MHLIQKWTFYNTGTISFCHFISFPPYQALQILLQCLQSMHRYLHIQKENTLPVRVPKLSPKCHTGMFVFIPSAVKEIM